MAERPDVLPGPARFGAGDCDAVSRRLRRLPPPGQPTWQAAIGVGAGGDAEPKTSPPMRVQAVRTKLDTGQRGLGGMTSAQ